MSLLDTDNFLTVKIFCVMRIAHTFNSRYKETTANSLSTQGC